MLLPHTICFFFAVNFHLYGFMLNVPVTTTGKQTPLIQWYRTTVLSCPQVLEARNFDWVQQRYFYLLHKSKAFIGKSGTANDDLHGWEESSGSFFTHMSTSGLEEFKFGFTWDHWPERVSGLCIWLERSLLNKAAMRIQEPQKVFSGE